MKTFSIFIISIYIVLISSLHIFSDTLYLKNGGTIEGIVEEKGDYYVVDLGYGTANFQKNTVSRVEYSSGGEREEIKGGWAEERARIKTETPTPVPAEKSEGQPRHLEIGESGQRVDITKYVVKGKITIFDFYSPYCGPCMRVAPRLERLVQTRDDIVVRKININRPSVQGIDWDSPVVKQYNIHSVPYFKIYNERGSLWLEGESASDKVYSWLE